MEGNLLAGVIIVMVGVTVSLISFILRERKYIKVTGAKTGKKMLIPISNFGMAMEVKREELEDKEYPEVCTRVHFRKELASGVKFADCKESFKKVINQL